MKNFKGILTALLTAFDKNGKINAKAMSDLVEFNLSQGVNGFYVGGSTGESMVMTAEERKELFAIVANATKGRATLIAHVGTISTDAACDMAKAAEKCGYDAISAVAPFYYSFSYEAIKGYYNDILNSCNLPMIIYNFPASGSFSFTAEKANEVIKDERIIGIKHTSQDLFLLNQFKKLDREIVVYNGYDEMLVAGLSMGADGGIGSTYNFMGNKYVKMFDAFNKGDLTTAMAIQEEVNLIIMQLIKYGVFQSEKAILSAMGIDMGDCRKPFLPISAEGKSVMTGIAKKLMAENK